MAKEERNSRPEAQSEPNDDEIKDSLLGSHNLWFPNISEPNLLNICTVLLHSALDLGRVFFFQIFEVGVLGFFLDFILLKHILRLLHLLKGNRTSKIAKFYQITNSKKINELRLIVCDSKRPSARSSTSILTTPCNATGWKAAQQNRICGCCLTASSTWASIVLRQPRRPTASWTYQE